MFLGGGGDRILEEEEELWVVFILEDRRPHDVQKEVRNTAEDLKVISIQRRGITSNYFPHHTSSSLLEFQIQEAYDSRVSNLFRICVSFVLFFKFVIRLFLLVKPNVILGN